MASSRSGRRLHGAQARDQRRQEARRLQKENDQHGAQHGALAVAEPTRQERELDIERQQRCEQVGCDVAREMAIERARQPERGAAEGKSLDLEHDDVLAGEARDLLVVADGPQHAAERRMNQTIDQKEQHDDGRNHDAEIEEIEQVRPELRRERAPECPRGRRCRWRSTARST